MQNMENNSAIIEPTIDDISSETLEKVGDVIAKIRELLQDEFGKRNFSLTYRDMEYRDLIELKDRQEKILFTT
ncbi:TPA: hypothetical protein RPW53_001656 [Campylobacter fetus subsp. venerealis]|nr:hypothetical protein [Campylobacter fetus subsp. venerealis]